MKHPHLFRPLKLRGVTYRNRIFASPTGLPMVMPPEYLKRECAAFYELRAQGGAAAVCLGDGIVHTPTGLTHPYKLRLDDSWIISSLSDTARRIRQYGAVPALELSHGGKYANVKNFISKAVVDGMPAYGPVRECTADGAEILEMPEEIILTIVEAYGAAAALAKRCGYGTVVVHGGHGWLLNQFMSPETNRRKDGYGGSRENRVRFPLMVLDSIRARVGDAFPVEFRMSGAEFTKNGYDIDEGVELAKLLAPKADLLHVSAGVHDDPDTTVITHPSMFHEHGCNVWLAERVKKAVDVPVVTIGGLNDPEQMEEILASGKADVVALGRALTADPFLPTKAAAGREDEIVKCIRCFLCLNQTLSMRNIRCSVNPVIGRELEHMHAVPPTPPRRVLVIGGGPAGAEAALEAARKGHDVTICDKNSRLGGQLLYEEHVPFKKEPDFGGRVVILGGGLVGCETAVRLTQIGREVTIVEMRGDCAADATVWHKHALRLQFRDKADIRLNTKAVAIVPGGIVAEGPGGRELIAADTVFCAAGVRPREASVDEFRNVAPYFYAIGDCAQPAQMFQAMSQGHFTGRSL
ncbi:MAG: FAD-dependent oxidoreductase [Clostridiales Family XIII bacterium]|nr:FAD-dependent oxidoreductase [Clostridiales Family XIII bacterium]